MKYLHALIKAVGILLAIALFLLLILLAANYKSDIPVEKLKEKYAFDDSEYLEMDGMQIHYRKVGQGTPLVLIHGYGGNLWNWEEWTDILKDSFQVISLDLPGFGFTGPRPDGDYSTAMYVDLLDRFFDQINVDSFYLAGNSMGGSISWQYTVKHPDRVRKLALVNSAGYPRNVGGKMPIGFKILALPGAKSIITKVTPKSVMRKTIEGIYAEEYPVAEAEVTQFMDMMRRTGNRKALFDRREADQGMGSEQIKQIQCPTLIIWGDQDRLINVENAYKFEQDIRNSQLIVYEKIGHVPMMEIPEQSAGDLRAFLEK